MGSVKAYNDLDDGIFITTAVQIHRAETTTPNIAQSMGYSLILPK